MSFFSDLLPKKTPKTGGLTIPSFLKKTKTGGTVTDSRTNDTNTDLTNKRYGQTTSAVVRDYVRVNPDASHASELLMRFCVTDSFSLVAKDMETDTIDVDATQTSQIFAARLNKLPRSYEGFSPQSSINSVAESLVKQLISNGDCCSELVLDAARLPAYIQCVSTNSLKYLNKSNRLVPQITVDNDKIELDSPTINIISLSQDPEIPYAESWFASAVQAIVESTAFTNDLRRSFRKASLPRVKATIDTAKYRESLSPEVLYDQEKLAAAMNSTITNLTDNLNGLNPEDAVINFDVVDVSHLTAGNISAHDSVATHSTIINGQISNGLHVLPSLLGRGESQATSSTEAVLFLKLVESLQGRLNEVFSYHFTTAARLQGLDVTVTFKFKKPSLRPEIEEEAFLSMRQSRLIEQLSLGLISDEEASIAITGDLPSGAFKPLSGTMFKDNNAEVENPFSNTSVSGDQLNNTSDQQTRQSGDKKPKSNKTTGK